MSGPGGLIFLLWILVLKDKGYDPVSLAVQNSAQLLHRKEGDGLVVLQMIDCSGIDAVLIDQGVSSDTFFFHSLPQRFVTDQTVPSPSNDIGIIIFGKSGLYYTEKSIYNDSGGGTVWMTEQRIYLLPLGSLLWIAYQ